MSDFTKLIANHEKRLLRKMWNFAPHISVKDLFPHFFDYFFFKTEGFNSTLSLSIWL